MVKMVTNSDWFCSLWSGHESGGGGGGSTWSAVMRLLPFQEGKEARPYGVEGRVALSPSQMLV